MPDREIGQGNPPADLDPQFIDGIAALLNDSEDDVQMCAAVALSNIGAPAARAIPALEAAAQRAFLKEYGDPPPPFVAESGIHTHGVIGFAAHSIREAALR